MSSNHKIRYDYDQDGNRRSKYLQTLENLDVPASGPAPQKHIHLITLRQYLKQRIIESLSPKKQLKQEPKGPFGTHKSMTSIKKPSYKDVPSKKLDFGTVPKDLNSKQASNNLASELLSAKDKILPLSQSSISVPKIDNSFLMKRKENENHQQQHSTLPPTPHQPIMPKKSTLFVASDDSETETESENAISQSTLKRIFVSLDSDDEDAFDEDGHPHFLPLDQEKFQPVDITSPVKINSQRRTSQIGGDINEHLNDELHSPAHISDHGSPEFHESTTDVFAIPEDTAVNLSPPSRRKLTIRKPIIAQPAKPQKPKLEPISKPSQPKKEQPESEEEDEDEEDEKDDEVEEDEEVENSEDESDDTYESNSIESADDEQDGEEKDDADADPSFDEDSYSKKGRKKLEISDSELEGLFSSDDEEAKRRAIDRNKRKGLARRKTAAEIRRRKLKEQEELSTSNSSDDTRYTSAREISGSDKDDDSASESGRRPRRLRGKVHDDEYQEEVGEDEFVVDDSDDLIYSSDDEFEKLLRTIESEEKKTELRHRRRHRRRYSHISSESENSSEGEVPVRSRKKRKKSVISSSSVSGSSQKIDPPSSKASQETKLTHSQSQNPPVPVAKSQGASSSTGSQEKSALKDHQAKKVKSTTSNSKATLNGKQGSKKKQSETSKPQSTGSKNDAKSNTLKDMPILVPRGPEPQKAQRNTKHRTTIGGRTKTSNSSNVARSSDQGRTGIRIIRDVPKKRKVERPKKSNKTQTTQTQTSPKASRNLVFPNRPEAKAAEHVDMSEEEELDEDDEEFKALYRKKVDAMKAIPSASDSESEEAGKNDLSARDTDGGDLDSLFNSPTEESPSMNLSEDNGEEEEREAEKEIEEEVEKEQEKETAVTNKAEQINVAKVGQDPVRPRDPRLARREAMAAQQRNKDTSHSINTAKPTSQRSTLSATQSSLPNFQQSQTLPPMTQPLAVSSQIYPQSAQFQYVSSASASVQPEPTVPPAPIEPISVSATPTPAPAETTTEPTYTVLSDSDDSDNESEDDDDLVLIDEDTFKKSFTPVS